NRKYFVWASPNSLTSGTLVINELVALDLTSGVDNFFQKNFKKLLTVFVIDDRIMKLSREGLLMK
ncbi:hypothetical protein, partial [Streptococcus suis]|uniref:hypothetical protein n=1 Tax=Streptococcus suis TaxID=1307 RepID=UPI001BB2C722